MRRADRPVAGGRTMVRPALELSARTDTAVTELFTGGAGL